METHELLEMYAKILAMYQKKVAKICKKYGMNHTCFDILVFLKNNPQYDTARSIEKKRGIKKSMASVAIETLYQLGYVNRCPDESDRRIQHLQLTEKSNEITNIGQQFQNEFQERMFHDLSLEERESYLKISEKLLSVLRDMEE